jgi:hypothetical protein
VDLRQCSSDKCEAIYVRDFHSQVVLAARKCTDVSSTDCDVQGQWKQYQKLSNGEIGSAPQVVQKESCHSRILVSEDLGGSCKCFSMASEARGTYALRRFVA